MQAENSSPVGDFSQLEEAALALLNSPLLSTLEQTELALDNTDLFSIALRKRERLKSLITLFRKASAFRLAILANPPNLALADPSHDLIVKTIWIESSDTSDILQLLEAESIPTLIWCTNNVIGKLGINGILAIKHRHPEYLFVVQDYDNHHWYKMSIICMLIGDIYIPSHYHHPPLSQHLQIHPSRVIPIGSIQWRRRFLTQQIDQMITAKRENLPKGVHTPYNRFPYRNKVIATLNTRMPKVSFSQDQNFHKLTEQEKLQDWLTAKLHFIVPVGDDIPIRVFDALVTGGIPIIPDRLFAALDALAIPRDHYFTYSVDDIVEPNRRLEQWIDLFDRKGTDGIISRSLRSIEHFHIDSIGKQILNFTFQLIFNTKGLEA